MKYITLLYDGMADYPVEALGGETPMSAAKTPYMDALCKNSVVGLAKTVPDGYPAGSDVANLSMMGYDPTECYTGRSPLEAASMGLTLNGDDLAFRCNTVTLSDDEPYDKKVMIDYSAGDISSAEASEIIDSVQKEFGKSPYSFHSGVSYRHCMLLSGGCSSLEKFIPPHDISDKVIGDYLSSAPANAPFMKMMRESYALLKNHPVNIERVKNGKRPANSIWLWGEGTKPRLQSFKDKTGLSGAVVSAVDLIKGIGQCAEMTVCDVEGATGYIDTNFEGKAKAALESLKSCDYVYIHVEAPDECGHRGEVQNKVRSIELIDERLLRILLDGLKTYNDYKILIAPDHPTPLSTKTHARDAVPFLIYHKNGHVSGPEKLTELSAKGGIYVDKAHSLLDMMLEG